MVYVGAGVGDSLYDCLCLLGHLQMHSIACVKFQNNGTNALSMA